MHCTSYALDWAPQPLIGPRVARILWGQHAARALQFIVRYQHFSRTKLEPKVISNTNAVDPNLPCTKCWHQASPRQRRMPPAMGGAACTAVPAQQSRKLRVQPVPSSNCFPPLVFLLLYLFRHTSGARGRAEIDRTASRTLISTQIWGGRMFVHRMGM